MSPDGIYNSKGVIWCMASNGNIHDYFYNSSYTLRPIINLKTSVIVTGTGTSTDPWTVV